MARVGSTSVARGGIAADCGAAKETGGDERAGAKPAVRSRQCRGGDAHSLGNSLAKVLRLAAAPSRQYITGGLGHDAVLALKGGGMGGSSPKGSTPKRDFFCAVPR
jgi:hypothetical protein